MRILKNFYCLEGINGAGKTSTSEALQSICEGSTRYVFTSKKEVKAFGSIITGLLNRDRALLEPEALEYLILAAHRENLYGQGGIAEALDNGKTVIVDRYLFTSLIYFSRFDSSLIKDFPLPQATFLLETTAETAYKRIQRRDINSKMTLAKIVSLAERYKTIMDLYSEERTGMKIYRYTNSKDGDVQRIARDILNRIKGDD